MQYCGLSAAPGCGRFVGHRELFLPARHLALPRAGVGLRRTAGEQRLDLDDDLFDHEAGIADDRDVGLADLALLGRVDVDMDDLGLLRERVDLAGDPVVESRAERDQQIGLLHRRDRRCVAVHAGHAEVQLVVVGEGAASHERRHDVDAGELDEFAPSASAARALRMPPPA